MNVIESDLVIVRGINSDWLEKNFSEMWIGFSGFGSAVPAKDAYYIGLYIEAPISAITHLGIVSKIERYDNNADFYLKAIIKLKKPYEPEHQIRKHVYMNLSDFNINKTELEIIRKNLNNF